MGVMSKGLGSPDQTMTFDHGMVEVVTVGEATLRRSTFQPGWRWSQDVGPTVKMDSCQVHHVGYVLSGRLHVVTEDGGEAELTPGQAYEILPGHDGWVAGDETLVTIEFSGAVT